MAEVERMSLDDILEEAPRRAKPNAEPKIIEPAPEPKEPAAPKEAKASPKPDERVRGPDGKFAPKEPEAKPSAELKPEPKAEPEAKAEPKPEPKAAPPAQPEFTERERAFQAAMLEERRKRQEIERRAQAEAERQAQLKPDGTPKTFWDDPEATLAQFEARIQSQAISTRLSTAEQIARSRYGSEDFDAKVGKFAEVMQATPGLYNQWLSAPDPAEFAYKTGKLHMELAEAGNLDALRAKIEAEARAKVEREYAERAAKAKEEEERQRQELSSLPGTLSDARGAAQHRVEWTGPTSLDDILGS